MITLGEACENATRGLAVGMLEESPFIASAVFGVWRDARGNLFVAPATAVEDQLAVRLLVKALRKVADDLESGNVPVVAVINPDGKPS